MDLRGFWDWWSVSLDSAFVQSSVWCVLTHSSFHSPSTIPSISPFSPCPSHLFCLIMHCLNEIPAGSLHMHSGFKRAPSPHHWLCCLQALACVWNVPGPTSNRVNGPHRAYMWVLRIACVGGTVWETRYSKCERCVYRMCVGVFLYILAAGVFYG